MSELVIETEYFKSKVDKKTQRYIIQYPEHTASDLLVCYLHSGIHPAEQGFKRGKQWSFGYVGDETAKRGGVYMSPDYRGDSWFNEAAEKDILDLIETTKDRFNIETVVLVGTSMGGGAALTFAAFHPELVNGVITTAPALDVLSFYKHNARATEYFNRSIVRSIDKAYGGSPETVGEQYYISRSPMAYADRFSMPIVIRQGDRDNTVPVETTRNMVCKLLENNTDLLYDEIPFATHDSVTERIPWKKYFDFVLKN